MTARARHDRPAVLAIPLLLLALLVAACDASTSSPSASASPIASDPMVTPTPAASATASPTGVPADVDALYDEIEREVAALRGLDPTGEVERQMLSADELADEIATLYREDSPVEIVAANERFYKALDLLPPDASLEDLSIELLSGGVAGYYRDDQKRLYVVSRSGRVGGNEKITFAHEFDHALQDQHFSIFADQQDVTNRSDWLLARQGLYEGDATLLMTLWAADNMTPQDFQEMLTEGLSDPSTELLERMPAILRETLLYPYTTGLAFVQQRFTTGGGWEAVDALYDAVPETTEQVLHPDKYEAGEGPIAIDVPDDLADRIGPAWELALDDTFGEFQMGVWLRDAEAPGATEAAAGWGGDRVLVLNGPDDTWATVLATAWDSEADAREFEAAAGPVVDGLADPAALLPGGGSTSRWVVVASSDDVLEAVTGALGLAG